MLRAAGKGAVSKRKVKQGLNSAETIFFCGATVQECPPLSVEFISWLIRLAFGLDYLLVLLWKKLLL